MEDANRKLSQPPSLRVYGEIVYWISIISATICILAPILSLAFPGRNIIDPQFLFSNIWAGMKPERIWSGLAGRFTGGHFWLSNLGYGDGLIQLGIVIGCSSAGLALLVTAITYLKMKPRSYGWAVISLVIAVFIVLSMLGIYQQAE